VFVYVVVLFYPVRYSTPLISNITTTLCILYFILELVGLVIGRYLMCKVHLRFATIFVASCKQYNGVKYRIVSYRPQIYSFAHEGILQPYTVRF